ncbi:Fur-regulated basic protein FbpA [Kurthia populi]|uniref:Fur-regulated basic protein FbpA n=1 Tax=Kurthia populi TaxID=1562132 RepID=A0ABW5XZI7_9BACL|nr:Fur-regulated basic protein FbpA [Kurthia sp. Dielmo]
MKKTLQDQECNKNHLVDHLLDLGIFKINGKQLYQATLQELIQAYQQYTMKPVHA